jgi:hypothetical protein
MRRAREKEEMKKAKKREIKRKRQCSSTYPW